ncbi:PepSY domain-containing protein [Microbacterium sp. NPDC076895]|uniref:PepSY domain-containing protein n=1 Tax=unclassified Microbacterium TaxID=2609290 RepID=UPI003414EF35
MKTTVKRAIATGTLVTALALGGTGVAVATTGGAATPADSTSSEQDPSYVGTIPAPNDGTADEAEGAEGAEGTEGPEGAEGAEGADDSAADAAESTALEGLATVTPEEATAAALKAVPGTAATAQLENENGFVVYGIEVTAADGTVIDVKVDAGDGSVLAQDAADAETAD